MALGKDQYKVIRETYLKSNPDAYSDNLYYIPVGEVVAKDVSSEYPFIMITYKGEIGYVSLNDLAPLSNATTNNDKKVKADSTTSADIGGQGEGENDGEGRENGGTQDPQPPITTDYSSWLEKIRSKIYLLLIIPIVFFGLLIWRLIKRKTILDSAKECIDRAKAVTQEAMAKVDISKSSISLVLDIINRNQSIDIDGLDSTINNLKSAKGKTENSERDIVKINSEINSIVKALSEVNNIKEALNLKNNSELARTNAISSLNAVSVEKAIVEKEINSFSLKIKDITSNVGNKAINDANSAKNKIGITTNNISATNKIIDKAYTDSNKFKSNSGVALKSALNELDVLKTNSNEIILSLNKVLLKANNVITDANAILRRVGAIEDIIDNKIRADRAKVNASAILAEANVIKSKSEDLLFQAELEKIKVSIALGEHNTPSEGSDTTIKAEEVVEIDINVTPPKINNPPNPTLEEIDNDFQLKYVNYDFKGVANTSSYPILLFPQKGCIVRSHKSIKVGRRGFKEISFQDSINSYFGNDFKILGDARLDTGRESRPFEPDIAIIDKKFNINLRIDIEIDEPYAGISRQPTHCIGEDIYRDNYFKDRGWIVIRFSEYQVHLFEGSALKFIAETIKSAIPNYIIPSNLSKMPSLAKDELWDTLQAQKWEKIKYRENYLKHKFEKEDTPHVFIKQDFTKQDLEEESKVKNSSIGAVEKTNEFKFNSNNKHNRDKRIEFYSEQHIYTIDKIPAVSVSTIIDKFFPVFDTKYWAAFKAPSLHMSPSAVEKMWKDKAELSIMEGKKLHDQIEDYFINKIKTDSKEFKLFESFLKENPNIEPYRTEWRIFDEKYLIAGTIDLVSKNKHEYEIYDWKRSHRIIGLKGEPIVDLGFGKFGLGKLSHISDSPFNRYCMQQNMYKFILEKNYGINIKAMYLVVLHPDYNTFYKIPVPYYKTEIEFILNSI